MQTYSIEVMQYKQSLPDEDIRRGIIIFQLTDDWASDLKLGQLREIIPS